MIRYFPTAQHTPEPDQSLNHWCHHHFDADGHRKAVRWPCPDAEAREVPDYEPDVVQVRAMLDGLLEIQRRLADPHINGFGVLNLQAVVGERLDRIVADYEWLLSQMREPA